MKMATNDWLMDVLQETDLTQFYSDILHELQLTQPEHFRHVNDSDLLKIGLSQPAARRLREAIDRKRRRLKRERVLSVFSRRSEPAQQQGPGNSLESATLSCLIPEQQLKIFEKLGEGSFSVVKRGVWTQPSGKKVHVAVKVLQDNSSVENEWIKEVNAMHTLYHPNLVRLFGVVLVSPVMMVVELCDGAVLDRLRDRGLPVVLVSLLWDWAVQIARGMAYLEALRFIHRDLAARNILLTMQERVVKIGDFGLMRILPQRSDLYVMSEQKKVPFAWCAPESLRFRQFSHASDVWMFGVTMWELFAYGEEPWCAHSGAEILKLLLSGERLPKPERCPASVYQVMLNCWTTEPSDRPTFLELKENMKRYAFPVGTFKEPHNGLEHLEGRVGDQVIVVDGNAASLMWYGQNTRTRLFGKFARRAIVLENKQRDISVPLKDSFVHAAHGDARGGQSWGEPGKIDDIYLRNPMPLLNLEGTKVSGEESGVKTLPLHGAVDNDSVRFRQRNSVADPNPPAQLVSSQSKYYSCPPDSTTIGLPTLPGPTKQFLPKPYDLPPPEESPRMRSPPSPNLHESRQSLRDNTLSAPISDTSVVSLRPTTPADDTNSLSSWETPPNDGEPDPFEIPADIRTLTLSKRYSDIYGAVPLMSGLEQPWKKFSLSTPASAFRASVTSTDVPPPASTFRASVASTDVPPPPPAAVTSHQVPKPTNPAPAPVVRPVTGFLSDRAQTFSGSAAVTPRPPWNTQPASQVTARIPSPRAPTFQPASTLGQPRVAYSTWAAPHVNTFNKFSTAQNLPPVVGPGSSTVRVERSAYSTSQTSTALLSPRILTTDTLTPSVRQQTVGFGGRATSARDILCLFDPLSDTVPDELVHQVRQKAPFASADKCRRVLKKHSLNVDQSVCDLKVEKLVDLNLGTKQSCIVALQAAGWDLDSAAVQLLG